MADRFFNRDRNRPYDDDYNEENYGQDSPSGGRYNRDYGYGRGYSMNRGYGMRGQDYGSGYSRYGGMNRSRYGSGGFDRYGSYHRGRTGYGTNRDYDYDFDYDQWNDRWSRADYGRGQGGYGYGGYGFGGGYGRDFGRGSYGGYGRGYGRSQSGYGTAGYGMPGYGGSDYDYDADYDMDFEDYEEPGIWTYEEIWIIPGPFTGIGPEGYQRSDDRIREDINERLTQHGRLNARNIQVEVNNCEVTLKGTVNTRQAKRMAEEVVESVSGVKDVNNQLRVQDQQQINVQSGMQQGQIGGQSQTQSQRGQQSQQQTQTGREGQSQRER